VLKLLGLIVMFLLWVVIWGLLSLLMQGSNQVLNSLAVLLALGVSSAVVWGIWKIFTPSQETAPPLFKCPKCEKFYHRVTDSRVLSYDIVEGDHTVRRSHTIYTCKCDDCEHQWETTIVWI